MAGFGRTVFKTVQFAYRCTVIGLGCFTLADILTRLALIAKNKIVARIVEAAHKRVEAKATEEEKAAMKKVVDTIRRERTGLRYCKACGIFNYAT